MITLPLLANVEDVLIQIILLSFSGNVLPHLVSLVSLTSVLLDFEGNSVGCNLPADLIQIAQYLKMFSIHSCQRRICSQNFHGQPCYLPVQDIVSYFWTQSTNKNGFWDYSFGVYLIFDIQVFSYFLKIQTILMQS